MNTTSYQYKILLSQHGFDFTLRKKSIPSYDPQTSQVSTSSPQDFTVTGFHYNYDEGLLAAEDIRRNRSRVVISAFNLSVEPDDDDLLLINSKEYTIKRVTTVFNANIAVVYICEVEK